jgi:hypothetical protein
LGHVGVRTVTKKMNFIASAVGVAERENSPGSVISIR